MVDWAEIGVSIRTVPEKRAHLADALLKRVQKFAPNCVLSPHASWRTVPESYADALKIYQLTDLKWVLQLEDDAILAPDFETEALRAFEHFTEKIGIVSFYSGRRIKSGEIIAPVGQPVEYETLPGARFLMAQGFAMRVADVEDHNQFMLNFTADNNRPYGTDTATGQWLKVRKLKYLRAWPSIVQHREVESLYRQRNRPNAPHTKNANRFSPSFTERYGTWI